MKPAMKRQLSDQARGLLSSAMDGAPLPQRVGRQRPQETKDAPPVSHKRISSPLLRHSSPSTYRVAPSQMARPAKQTSPLASPRQPPPHTMRAALRPVPANEGPLSSSLSCSPALSQGETAGEVFILRFVWRPAAALFTASVCCLALALAAFSPRCCSHD